MIQDNAIEGSNFDPYLGRFNVCKSPWFKVLPGLEQGNTNRGNIMTQEWHKSLFWNIRLFEFLFSTNDGEILEDINFYFLFTRGKDILISFFFFFR